MGGSCCKTSGDMEIKFKHTNSYINKIGKNNNNIKLNIINNNGYSIQMDIDRNWTFDEIKDKYCQLIGKKDNNKLIFVYKSKVLEESDSPISLDIDKEITIYAFDGNDYNT